MPNWCQNILYLSHKDEALRTRAFRALDRNEFLSVMVPVTEDSRESRIESWGTKWDVRVRMSLMVEDGRIIADFESAWSPPIQAYETLSSKYGFEIVAYYYEHGCGFIGKFTNEEGEMTYDLEEDEDDIPDDIKDVFYENEEEDEDQDQDEDEDDQAYENEDQDQDEDEDEDDSSTEYEDEDDSSTEYEKEDTPEEKQD